MILIGAQTCSWRGNQGREAKFFLKKELKTFLCFRRFQHRVSGLV
jgi:hypothetical protein